MIKKIDHGYSCKGPKVTLKPKEEVLGLKSTGTEVVEEQKVKVAFTHRIVRLSCWSQHRPDPSLNTLQRMGKDQHLAFRSTT